MTSIARTDESRRDASARVHRLDDEQRFFPISHVAGEYEHPEALAVMELRSSNLAMENRELMSQEGIFSTQFGFGIGEIRECPSHKRGGRRTQKSSLDWFEPQSDCAKQSEEKGNERDI